MDPEAEQDNAECEMEVFEDHPEFAISDPGDLPSSSHETTSAFYKKKLNYIQMKK